MKGIVLYHPKSEHSGLVEDFQHDYKKHKNKDLELLSLETLDGSEKARLYDVTSYPAVMVMADDGELIKFWQGQLPSMDELSSYLHQ